MTDDQDKRGANVRVPPPLLFFTVVLLAYFVHRQWPAFLLEFANLTLIGYILILAGIVLGLTFFIAFRRAKTHVEPWKPTARLVTSGIYGYSRNPAYLSFCIIAIGLGFVYNSVWVLLSFVPAAYLVWLFVIRKEEAYLEAKFGEEYLRYKQKVRRWI